MCNSSQLGYLLILPQMTDYTHILRLFNGSIFYVEFIYHEGAY